MVDSQRHERPIASNVEVHLCSIKLMGISCYIIIIIVIIETCPIVIILSCHFKSRFRRNILRCIVVTNTGCR